MYKVLLLIILMVASCGTSKNTNEVISVANSENNSSLQEGKIILTLNEERTVSDLTIHFKEVLEDSRCPTGTTCFWQGRVKILVETSEDGMTVDKSEIIFGELKDGEIKNHTFYKSGSTTITATAVNPYPTEESGTSNLPYELVLEVNQ